MSNSPLGSSYLRFFASGGAVDQKWGAVETSALISPSGMAGATAANPIATNTPSRPNPDNVKTDIETFYPDLDNPIEIEDPFDPPSALSSYAKGAVAIPATIGNYFLREGAESGDIDFIGGSQLLEDAATMGGAMWKGVKSEPMEFLKDMTPVLGQYRAFNRAESFREDADLLEEEGDLAGAEDLRQFASMEMLDAMSIFPLAGVAGKMATPRISNAGNITGPLYSPLTTPQAPLFSAALEGINRLDARTYTKSELLKALRGEKTSSEGGTITSIPGRSVAALERWLAEIPEGDSLSREDWLNHAVELGADAPTNPANFSLDVIEPTTESTKNLHPGTMISPFGVSTEGSVLGVNRMSTSSPYIDQLLSEGKTPFTGGHFSDIPKINNETAFSRARPALGYPADTDFEAGAVVPSQGVVLQELQSDLYNKVRGRRKKDREELVEARDFFEHRLSAYEEGFAPYREAYRHAMERAGVLPPSASNSSWHKDQVETIYKEKTAREALAKRKFDALWEGNLPLYNQLEAEWSDAWDSLYRKEKGLKNYEKAEGEVFDFLDNNPNYRALVTGDLDRDVLLPDSPFNSIQREYQIFKEAPNVLYNDQQLAKYALGKKEDGSPRVLSQPIDEAYPELRDTNSPFGLLRSTNNSWSKRYPVGDPPTVDFLKDSAAQIEMMIEGSLAEALRDPNNRWLALPDPDAYSKPSLKETYSNIVPKSAKLVVSRLNSYYKETYGIDDFFKLERIKVEGSVPETSDPDGLVPKTKTLDAITWDNSSEALTTVQRQGLPFRDGGEVSRTAWEEINGY